MISWSYDNWGTKWDICEKNNNRVAEISEDFKSVTLRFNSAWHPPFTFYENMIDLGFSVEAYYCRSNDEICGQFLNEREEEYYISDASSEEIPDIIPKAIDEALGITRRIAELEKIFEDLLEEEGEGDEEDEGEEAA